MKRPIGVFDSGIGGLTVVKELMRQLPEEDIVYLGDIAHLPYGIKSPSTIIRFTLDNVLFLLKQRVKLIIIACNTASSLALDAMKDHFSIPIVGVIQPGAKRAVSLTKTNCIGVIGTRSTIKSKAYDKQIKKINPDIQVISQACPLFVPLVEEGWLNEPEAVSIAKKYLKALKRKNPKMDTLILGCTHYPLLKPIIRQIFKDKVTLIDSAQQVVRQVSGLLIEQGLIKHNSRRNGKYKFFVTDDPEAFTFQAARFLGYRLSEVRRIVNV